MLMQGVIHHAKNSILVMEIPTGAFSALKQTADEFAKNMRIAAAAKWYEKGMVAQEKRRIVC